MGLKKKFEELQQSVQELTNIVKTQELVRLREESKELKEIKEYLSHVQFKLKDVKAFEGEELGKINIRITYQLPVVTLTLDSEGNPNKDDFFYSSNILGLLSFEDMKKIQKVLETEKNKINKK